VHFQGDTMSINAIYHVSDIASGGLLTTIKDGIISTYKGYFEEKFNELIKELLNNSITEQDIIDWVEKLGDTDKDIYFSIINKNLISETKIKRFLLSKILFYKVKNPKLDYFHSNLLTNIDLFVEEDFINFNILCTNYEKNEIDEGEESIKISINKFSSLNYQITISKLKSIGILSNKEYAQKWGEEGCLYVGKSEGFDKLCEYLNEYF
jgi:hypothetical protein